MTKSGVMFFTVLAIVIALLAWGGSAQMQSSEARESALMAEDSIATLLGVVTASEQRAALQDARVAEISDSLALERQVRAEEREEHREQINDARDAGAAALDAARSRVSDEVRIFLDEHEREDSVLVAGYEATITSLEADTTALALELRETQRQALFAQQGWDHEKALRIQETLRADSWERVANPPWHQKLVDALPSAGIGVTLAVIGTVLVLR